MVMSTPSHEEFLASSLQDHWRVYKEQVYPKGTVPQQNRQLHMAFMAGALVMYTQVTEISATLPEKDAMLRLAEILKELDAYAAAQRQEMEYAKLRQQ
jgi:hypothetical protein